MLHIGNSWKPSKNNNTNFQLSSLIMKGLCDHRGRANALNCYEQKERTALISIRHTDVLLLYMPPTKALNCWIPLMIDVANVHSWLSKPTLCKFAQRKWCKVFLGGAWILYVLPTQESAQSIAFKYIRYFTVHSFCCSCPTDCLSPLYNAATTWLMTLEHLVED